jgi:hypothetical protein
MSKLSFSLNGIIMKHSTEVRKGLIFKRMNVKCSDTDEINDILEALSGWGKATDPISNIQVLRNIDDDPNTKRFYALDEYGICMNLKIYDDVVPVHFKSIGINIKSKKLKDPITGEKYVEKYLEANLVFEKQPLDSDKRFDDLYLKHTEPDEDGKEVITPLNIQLTQIEYFNLYGDQVKEEQENAADNDDGEVVPQVFQNS